MDFDGVILDSMPLKTQAFATVYGGEPAVKREEVLAYQRLHGGVTRRTKFAYFERQIFARSGDAEEVERLAAAYRDIIYDAVVACAFVPGAERFLEIAHGRIELHLISGTPQEELRDIVALRGLARYFRSVVGAPTTKRDAFAAILALHRHAPATTVAIGDATTEYDAACELGIPFVAVVPPGAGNAFPPAVPVVASLETLPRILGLR